MSRITRGMMADIPPPKKRKKVEVVVTCKLCHEECPAETAHLHQGEWVGECCWDPRLKVTE